MYVVPFVSESGDHYIMGPFKEYPSTEQVLDVLLKDCPDEGEYVRQLIAKGTYSKDPFRVLKLPRTPGIAQRAKKK